MVRYESSPFLILAFAGDRETLPRSCPTEERLCRVIISMS